ncbi:MAG: hypothetical protein V4539_03150 [Bacteroidota bacterium]
MKNRFQYNKAQPLAGWGYRFDSMTEVKFAISVMEEFAFIRSPVSMYFHPGSFQLTAHPRLFHRRYTPDFLIRHLRTKMAFLVEIKPRAFERNTELDQHRQVATNYIRALKFDWIYKVVYDDEIILNEQQLHDFEECLSLKPEFRYAWFDKYLKRMSSLPPRLMDRSNAHIDFIMRGWESAAPNLFTPIK